MAAKWSALEAAANDKRQKLEEATHLVQEHKRFTGAARDLLTFYKVSLTLAPRTRAHKS